MPIPILPASYASLRAFFAQPLQITNGALCAATIAGAVAVSLPWFTLVVLGGCGLLFLARFSDSWHVASEHSAEIEETSMSESSDADHDGAERAEPLRRFEDDVLDGEDFLLIVDDVVLDQFLLGKHASEPVDSPSGDAAARSRDAR